MNLTVEAYEILTFKKGKFRSGNFRRKSSFIVMICLALVIIRYDHRVFTGHCGAFKGAFSYELC